MSTEKQKLQGGQLVVWLASEYHSINFALMARIRGSFTPDQFQRALDKLQLKHPALSANVVQEADGSVYLIPKPAVEFPVRIVDREHAESWVEQATTELEQPFDLLNNPPIRFVLLRGKDVSEVLFVCPHALADGLATAYLVRDFLTFLNDPDVDVAPMPPAQPMSELIPNFPGKGMAILLAKLKARLLKMYLSLSTKKSQADVVGPVEPKYHLLPWILTAEQTSALAARSRAEGTTVHAALCVAFLRAFGEFYQDGWKRKISSPVSLRERLAHPVGEAFGLFVNLVEFCIDCAPERDFWDVARAIKRGFVRRTGDKQIFNSLIEANVVTGQLGQVLTPQIVAQSFMAIDYDLSITNLGRLDFPTRYGSLQLDALFGPILGGDPQDIVLGVITIGGNMHLGLSFTALRMNTSQAEQVVETAMSWLADAVVERKTPVN
jgi:hypothetical protein